MLDINEAATEDKIPYTLLNIYDVLERIASTLEMMSERGIKVKQLSPDCMNDSHGNEWGGCVNCGCGCHD